jgi:GAF domain-containing protein
MVSCYAYDKKKYIDKKLHVGQGLVGQAVMEKDTIYITHIPANYVQITSGLGEATPRSVIIVPLKTNDHVMGAIEVASFEKLEKHEIEFLEKLTESIAASIGSIRTNERTREMVNQLQQQTEQMRSQEEEMRQNMEELSATQEEMIRKEQEYISRIRSLETTTNTAERNFN